MGCDGGTIPRRNELWRYCNITQQLLQRPIVTCRLGKLYNKSAVIEAIISKDGLPPHIKNLKDVVELKPTPNPEFKDNGIDQTEVSPYICPVTGLEMSGKFRFVALWCCGCVFSERALKEVKMNTCPKCQEGFDDIDVLILNPNEDDLKIMTKKMKLRKKRNHKNVECKKMKM